MYPDKNGYYGMFGGKFVAETLYNSLSGLEKAFKHFNNDKKIKNNFRNY